MTEQNIEKMPQEQTEVDMIVVTDDPEAERITKNEECGEGAKSLLVPEAESMPVNYNACFSDVHVKTSENEEKVTQVEEQSTEFSGDLSETEKKSLQDLKHIVQEALKRHEFGVTSSPSKQVTQQMSVEKERETMEGRAKTEPRTEKDPFPEHSVQHDGKAIVEEDGTKTVEAIEETIVAVSTPVVVQGKTKESVSMDVKAAEEVFIWGVKLLEDEKTDTILLKFLRARDFKVKDAFTMMKNTIKWRKEFGIDQILEENLGSDLEKVIFMHGCCKEGHPVCYNIYGEFQDKKLYQRTFSNEEKTQNFLRWRIQFLEKSIRKLDFIPGGVSTILQVNDLGNSPGPNKWELRQATKQALHLLQDNYPEFVAKQIFINVPWWYLALNKMISPFLTQRTKSKFVVASPSKSTETLFKYISAEQIPIQYGGLSKDGDFGTADCVTEIMIKPSSNHIVEFPVTQACVVSWEVRVVEWEVNYGAEFVPNGEDGYTVIVQKMSKIRSNQEQVICNRYSVIEAGDLLLTFTNLTSKKKKLFYRFKITSYLNSN